MRSPPEMVLEFETNFKIKISFNSYIMSSHLFDFNMASFISFKYGFLQRVDTSSNLAII